MMKWPLLLLIRLYWAIVPDKFRRGCLFSESCSRFVYRKALENGLRSGLSALKYRWRNCRDGYHVCEHPVSGSRSLLLAGGDLIGEEGMAGRLLKTAAPTTIKMQDRSLMHFELSRQLINL